MDRNLESTEQNRRRPRGAMADLHCSKTMQGKLQPCWRRLRKGWTSCCCAAI